MAKGHAETGSADWQGSQLREQDALLVYSVGGGDAERNISSNLVGALQYARQVGANISGIVGRDGGFTARVSDACVVVPNGESGNRHPAHRIFPGSDLASASLRIRD